MTDDSQPQDVIAETRVLVDNLTYANGAAFCDAIDLQATRLRAAVRADDEIEEILRRLRTAAEELAADVARAGAVPSELTARVSAPLRDKCLRHLDRLSALAGRAAPNPMAALLKLAVETPAGEAGA